MDKGNVEFIIHPSLQESISNDLSLYKILYFVAPYGWGKTTQIQIWRNGGSGNQTGGIVYLNCKDTEQVLDRIQKIDDSIPQTFIFDDFHKADKNKIYSELDAMVNRSDDRVKMIFLSRVKIPDFLLIPLLSGRLKIYTIKELMIPLECALRYFGDSGIRLSALEIQNYEKHFAGYPLFIKLLRDQLVEDRKFLGEKLIMANAYNLYRVFDTYFLAKWSKRVQRFLMCVAGIPSFSMELAKAVYGPGSVEEIIEEILDTGSYMSQVGGNRYFIQENFNRYLSYTCLLYTSFPTTVKTRWAS